jgi:putative tryptophan/tyrosine transport system substrate-binding protein
MAHAPNGRSARMDVRWADSSTDLMRTFAKELVDLQPDVILSNSTPATAAFKRETQTIPIVFTIVTDPVGAGFVASLPHLGGNITGPSPFQESLTSKWLELLREIASGLKRAAMMFNPDTAPFTRSFFQPSFEATAQSFGMTPVVAPVHSDVEIETVITALGREPGGGLLTVPDAFIDGHRAPIISLAACGQAATFERLRRRVAVLRSGLPRDISSRCPPCRQRSPWREAVGASGPVANEIRHGHQSEDCQGAWA